MSEFKRFRFDDDASLMQKAIYRLYAETPFERNFDNKMAWAIRQQLNEAAADESTDTAAELARDRRRDYRAGGLW